MGMLKAEKLFTSINKAEKMRKPSAGKQLLYEMAHLNFLFTFTI